MKETILILLFCKRALRKRQYSYNESCTWYRVCATLVCLRVVSSTWLTHMNESCSATHSCHVSSSCSVIHMNVTHKWVMSQISHMNESCFATHSFPVSSYDWHIWMSQVSCVTHECVMSQMSHINESCFVTYSCHVSSSCSVIRINITCERIMSHM